MRKLAIVIPLLGEVERLESTLVSVLENRPSDCELLVVLNSRYDDPYGLADEVHFVEARRGAKLVDCINAGIEQTTAPIVHILAAGCEVSENWTDSAIRQFRDPNVAAVSPLVLSAADRGQIVTAGVAYRRGGATRHIGQGRPAGGLGPWVAEMQGPSLLAGFYRKSVLESLGGFDSFVGDGQAAADAAIQIRSQGYRTLLDPQSKVTAAPEMLSDHSGSLAQGLGAERMFLRHVGRGQWAAALAAHGLLVAGEFVRSLPRPVALLNVAGRALAWLQFSKCRADHRRLAELMTAEHTRAPKSGTHGIPRPHAGTLRAASLQPANKI